MGLLQTYSIAAVASTEDDTDTAKAADAQSAGLKMCMAGDYTRPLFGFT
jgi:hypothetical protein